MTDQSDSDSAEHVTGFAAVSIRRYKDQAFTDSADQVAQEVPVALVL